MNKEEIKSKLEALLAEQYEGKSAAGNTITKATVHIGEICECFPNSDAFNTKFQNDEIDGGDAKDIATIEQKMAKKLTDKKLKFSEAQEMAKYLEQKCYKYNLPMIAGFASFSMDCQYKKGKSTYVATTKNVGVIFAVSDGELQIVSILSDAMTTSEDAADKLYWIIQIIGTIIVIIGLILYFI